MLCIVVQEHNYDMKGEYNLVVYIKYEEAE
jgi:hypothetical protein